MTESFKCARIDDRRSVKGLMCEHGFEYIYVCIYIYIYICHFEIDEEFGLDVNGGPGPYCPCVVFSLSGVGLVIYSVAAVLR